MLGLPFHQLVFLLLEIVPCGYSVVRGGVAEPVTALSFVVAAFMTRVASTFSPSYQHVVTGVVVIDLVLLAWLLGLAITSARFWPIPMASMQCCGVLGHFAKMLGSDILPRAYFATVSIWGFPMLILLGVATWRHRQRLQRYGIDYPWVWSLPRRYRDGWSVDELARPLPQN